MSMSMSINSLLTVFKNMLAGMLEGGLAATMTIARDIYNGTFSLADLMDPTTAALLMPEWKQAMIEAKNVCVKLGYAADAAGNMAAAGARLGQQLLPFQLPTVVVLTAQAMQQQVMLLTILLVLTLIRYLPRKVWSYIVLLCCCLAFSISIVA